jgi:hypothetical protein
MHSFTVDPRDGGLIGSCDTCCCTPVQMRAGVTEKWTINYAPWSVPLGGVGLVSGTMVSVEEIRGCAAAVGADSPTVIAGGWFVTATSNGSAENPIPLLGGLVLNATVARLLPQFGPKHGTATITNGILTYKADFGYSGYDRLFVELSNGVLPPRIWECVIAVSSVGQATPTPVANASMLTPPVKYNLSEQTISQRAHQTALPVSVSPTACVGSIYRITVNQPARDCDSDYNHIACYDLSIGRCR